MAKLAKLRREPAQFFRDANSPLLRTLGRLGAPLLESDAAREFMLAPLESLVDVPLAGGVAQWLLSRQRSARQDLIRSAGTPQVSVVMAARNAASTIDSALRSLVRQSYSNLEIVVVDDGSVDATASVARTIGDSRIVVHTLPTATGAANARNHGLANLRGEFVTFNDSDDRSHPERIERQLAALLARPAAQLCVCSMQREDLQGRPVSINGRRVAKAVISMMFRRSVLDAVGFLRDLPVSEDAEFYERIKATFGVASEVVVLDRLYFADYRPESLLFSDGDVADQKNQQVAHKRSSEAEAKWAEILGQVARIRKGLESPYVPRAGS